jgi:phosphotransacetylase
MALDGFPRLISGADARRAPVPIAVAGGDDPTVLQALRVACDSGWIQPALFGPDAQIRAIAASNGIALGGLEIRHAEGDAVAAAAVGEVRSGRARALMKGRITTSRLMEAVLHPQIGLRTERVICQVVLMEILRDRRRFLLADTGICVRPSFAKRKSILKSTVELAQTLGLERPKVAMMAATEAVNHSMPETLEAAEFERRARQGEFGNCVVEGPLSFDLAYAADAAAKKQLEGAVVGAADIMLFPSLLAANLTVKAIMYTSDCRFGGILRGTSAPVVFMSRADSTETRLNSLALALRILHDEPDAPGTRQSAD